MTRRVILIGATGAFGERLARLLAPWPDIELVLAARRQDPLQALAAELALEWARFDREQPETLGLLRPWAVVDAAGPFQTSDLRLARAAVAAGAHYVDIADGRAFVAAFPAALDAEARARGVAAITGASSTPALSNAALDAITRDWREIKRVTVLISPGARAPRGLSVLRAILSYVGRPVRVFTGGAWRDEPGWSGVRRLVIPGLGSRLASLCETPDLDIMATRATSEARFLAGLELGLLHIGLWLLSWPVRWKLITSLEPYARSLQAMAGLAAPFGSDRGGWWSRLRAWIHQANRSSRVGAWWRRPTRGRLYPSRPRRRSCAGWLVMSTAWLGPEPASVCCLPTRSSANWPGCRSRRGAMRALRRPPPF